MHLVPKKTSMLTALAVYQHKYTDCRALQYVIADSNKDATVSIMGQGQLCCNSSCNLSAAGGNMLYVVW